MLCKLPMPICFAFSCAASAASFAASRESMGTCLVAELDAMFGCEIVDTKL